jgi:hypothetical protein
VWFHQVVVLCGFSSKGDPQLIDLMLHDKNGNWSLKVSHAFLNGGAHLASGGNYSQKSITVKSLFLLTERQKWLHVECAMSEKMH